MVGVIDREWPTGKLSAVETKTISQVWPRPLKSGNNSLMHFTAI